MNEHEIFAQPSTGTDPETASEKKEMSAEEILKEKLTILRGGIIKALGSENYKKTSQCLYTVLYHQEDIERLIADLGIEDTKAFPNRTSTLKMPLATSAKSTPDEEDFIASITRALAVEPDFKECVYAGAEEQLTNMAHMGPVRIWTAGDAHGLTDTDGKFIPGSKGQLKKISLAGNLNEMRKNIAQESKQQHPEAPRERTDILTVLATENKFSLISSIGEEFQKKGIKIVAIMEDNLKYLIRAEEAIKKFNLEVLPIWIRQGDRKNSIPKDSGKDLAYYLERYNAQDSVEGIGGVLEKHRISAESQPGFIVDYDEVIMDSSKKLAAQEEAVFAALKKRDWI